MQEAISPGFHASGASRAIEVLGDAWVLRILRTSFRGVRRFSEYMRELESSRAVLSDRLDRMCRDGLLTKVEVSGAHPEYRLTEKGLGLWGVLIGMWQWERNWGTGVDDASPVHDRPRSRLIHTACGQAIDPVYTCGHCNVPVSPFDTYGVAGPGSPTEISPPLADRKRYRKSHSDARGSLPTLMRVFGDRWNTALMAAAFQGQKTFSELSAATGIWPTSLSDRLEELQIMGMLRGQSYAGSRQEYRLTRAAVATFPITVELIRWGDEWLWNGKPPLLVMHRVCGHLLQPQWKCPHCSVGLQRTTIRFE